MYLSRDIAPVGVVASASDKATKSRNPVALEEGRYVTILEPTAVGNNLEALGASDAVQEGVGELRWEKALFVRGARINANLENLRESTRIYANLPP